MKRLIALLSAILVAMPCFAQATANLSSQGYYADPEIRIFDHQYWIYPTSSNVGEQSDESHFNPQQSELRKQHVVHKAYLSQTSLDAFSSPDLVHWTKHPHVLSVANVSWAAYAVWAPSAIYRNGKYYLFFAANDIQKTDTFPGGIGVAVSNKPGGPFKDALGKPLIGAFQNGAQPIDPMAFQDEDGSVYLYYGGQGHCNVAKLSSDLTRVILMPDGTLYKEITPAHYTEGPFMIKRNGTYYFMWSEGDWGNSTYGVAYAKSTSPIGPFTPAGKILSTDPAIANGPGHHSVVRIPNTDDWYIVYHRHPLDTGDRNQRVMAIDPLRFDKNGNIESVLMTSNGPAAAPLAHKVANIP